MYFRVLHDEGSGTLGYLLGDRDAAEALLIDPRGADAPVWRAMLREHGLRLRWVLRTHEHAAPAGAHDGTAAAFGAPDAAVPGGDQCWLPFGAEHVQVLETPGHTRGCRSYLWRDRLFCGDLLTMEACPAQREPALPEAMWDSVMRCVFTLPPETLLFPGHAPHAGAVSTIMEQRRWHPWFAGGTRDEFLARFARRRPPRAPRCGARRS